MGPGDGTANGVWILENGKEAHLERAVSYSKIRSGKFAPVCSIRSSKPHCRPLTSDSSSLRCDLLSE